jgi:hypothetical protein
VRAEHETEVVERGEPGLGLVGSEAVPFDRLLHRPQRALAARVELAADEAPVLGLGLRVLGMSRREEPAEVGMVRLAVDPLAQALGNLVDNASDTEAEPCVSTPGRRTAQSLCG